MVSGAGAFDYANMLMFSLLVPTKSSYGSWERYYISRVFGHRSNSDLMMELDDHYCIMTHLEGKRECLSCYFWPVSQFPAATGIYLSGLLAHNALSYQKFFVTYYMIGIPDAICGRHDEQLEATQEL